MNFAQMMTAAAIVLAALSVHNAQANPALATNNVNLRQGPGTTYPVIATIPGGSTVEISGCSGEWCNVVWQGRTGYSIATSFDQGGNAPPGGAPPPGSPPPAAGGPPPPGGGPPPGTSAGGPPPGYPPPPGGYPPPPPGYYPPPPGYYPPPYGYGPGPYYPYGYYGPYWRRRYW